jgi:hypothetical protein
MGRRLGHEGVQRRARVQKKITETEKAIREGKIKTLEG